MLGFINTVINIVQLGIMGKKALESDAGKKAMKKTGEVARDVTCAGVEVGVTAYQHASETACTIVNEVNNRIKRKSEQENPNKESYNSGDDETSNCNSSED